MTAPNTGAPEWAAGQASPWIPANKAVRVFDAFATRVIVDEMDRLSPPGSCSDGARYLINGTGTGAWATHNNQLAIASGADAANGWIFATVSVEGTLLYDRETDTSWRHNGSTWVVVAGDVANLDDLLDVTTAGAADGYVLKYDAAYGVWYAAPLVAQVITESFVLAPSDETTALATGTAKLTFRMPYAFTLTAVRCSLTTAQTSGSIFTVDINENGSSILSTKLTIDNTEKTSTSANTPAVISDASIADDAEITVDIDQIGDGTAKGLKVVLIGHQ